ncbi:hypothetical protein IFM89_019124 [Coptis chinensis]|uniref:Uncharacterized protein n=1 Tax=Coptis chinensis TaxID=261450 RepID=A0A835HTV6_9MAGN|nr:hypothetical protein IFM89_019124 [Coptis chinensis]
MARVSRFILGIIVRSIEQKVLFNRDSNSNIIQDESFSISLFIRTSCSCFVCGICNSNLDQVQKRSMLCFGALAMVLPGPITVTGLTTTVVDAAVASGIAVEKELEKMAQLPPVV